MYLARELQKYFRQSGNKYLFQNGMTLNELAGRMDEVTESGEVDVSVISRAINGHRPFTDWQLDAFCKALGLAEEQRFDLTYAMAQDRCQDAGLDIHLAMTPPGVAFVAKNITRINQAHEQGELELALDMLYDLYQWRCELDSADVPTPVIRIYAQMNTAREQLIDVIAHSQWPVEISELDAIVLPSLAELVESIRADISSDELIQLINCCPPLSYIEQQAWDQRYRVQLSVEQIATNLGLSPITVESLLFAARFKALTYVEELNTSP